MRLYFNNTNKRRYTKDYREWKLEEEKTKYMKHANLAMRTVSHLKGDKFEIDRAYKQLFCPFIIETSILSQLDSFYYFAVASHVIALVDAFFMIRVINHVIILSYLNN